jgi:hypothetical protein
MADTPNTAPTGAPIPDAQAGASAIQLDQSQVQTAPNAMQADNSQKGPMPASEPVQQSVTVDGGNDKTPQVPTEQSDTSGMGLNPDDPKNQTKQNPAYQTPAATKAMHPAIQKASLLNEIATTLAGGPRYQTTVDANTGQITRTKVPLSTKQLGMAIALEALSGAITGVAQHGPNHVAAAAAAGYQQGQQESNEVQQAQQDQEAQAKGDFALKAQTTKNNFQMYQLTRQQSELDYDTNQKHIDTYAPIIDTARENGGVKAEGVEGTSADDVAKRFNVTTDLVIPEGKPIPRYDPATGKQAVDPNTGVPLWNLQFAVLDPAVAGNISPKLASRAAALALPGSFTVDKDGNRVPIKLPDSTQLKMGLQVSWANGIAAIDTAQAHIGQQLSNLPNGDKYVKELEGNLNHAYENKVSQTALSTASRLATVPIDQWQATMKTMKTPLDVMGQVMSLIPQDAMEAAVKQTEQKKADAATAAAVQKAQALAPIEAAAAKDKALATAPITEATHRANLAADVAAASGKAKGAEIGRIEGRVAEGLPKEKTAAATGTMSQENMTHPELAQYVQDDKNYNTPDGTNRAFLQAMMKTDPERARTLQAYANGMDRQSFYAAAKAYGGGFNADLHAFDPSYNVGDIDKYFNAQKSLSPDGLQAKTNTAFNSVIQHLNRAYKAIGLASMVGQSGEYNADIHNASTEMAGFYVGGKKPGENEIKGKLDAYQSANPVKAANALIADAKDAMVKQVANYDVIDGTLPKGVKRPYFMSQQAAQDYKQLTGQDVDDRLVYHPPEGSQPILNNVKAVVGYQLPNGSRVNAFGVGAHNFGQSINQQPNHADSIAAGVPAGATAARLNGKVVGYKDAQGNYHSL